MVRTCPKCGHYHNRNHSWCKPCNDEYRNSPERLSRSRAYARKYHQENRETTIEAKAVWRSSLTGRALQLVNNADSRAKRLGVPFDLDRKWVYERLLEKCPLTGVTFDLSPPKDGNRANPNAPSLDRIDSRKGYTKDNVRVVTVHANIALNEFGLDALVILSQNIIRTISSQALPTGIEGSTTIPQGSRAKRPEAHGTRQGDDIVCSVE